MPTEALHLEKAWHNHKLLTRMIENNDEEFADWIVTVAFYCSLHLVEAAFANDPAIGHSQDHRDRLAVLHSQRSYEHILKHFKILYDRSRVARYMVDQGATGNAYDFSKFLPFALVKSDVVNNRLLQVRKSVTAKLSADGQVFVKDRFGG